MGEETLAAAELESLQRMAGPSKTGAGKNCPEKHKWGKTEFLQQCCRKGPKTLQRNRWTVPFLHNT